MANLIIRQPEAFATEYQGYRGVLCMLDQLGRHGLGVVEMRQGKAAQPRAGTYHLHAVTHGLRDVFDDACVVDDIGGACGQPRKSP